MMKKLLILLFAIALCSCGSTPSKNSNNNEPSDKASEETVDLTPSITNENMIHYLGRHEVKKDSVYFAFSGAGFEIKVNVKENENSVIGFISSIVTQYGPTQYAYVYVDGVEPSEKLHIAGALQSYELVTNLSLGEHIIRFVKLDEAFTSITLNDLDFIGCEWVRFDKKYEKRIGFYGDSITCGYGTDGTTSEGFGLNTENFGHTYAYTCASELDYDYTVVAQSGLSICMNSWGSEIYFKDIYKTIDNTEEYDHHNDPVDIAVIALGTNDNTKFSTYTADEQKEKVELIYQGYIEIAEMMKEVNLNTQFFFIYDLMLFQNGLITTAIKGTTLYLNDKYGDGTAYMLEFTPDHAGSGAHPGAIASMNDGRILAEFIKNPYEEDY